MTKENGRMPDVVGGNNRDVAHSQMWSMGGEMLQLSNFRLFYCRVDLRCQNGSLLR